jgi:hypothetical protein
MTFNGSRTFTTSVKAIADRAEGSRKREERAEETLRRKRLHLSQQAKMVFFFKGLPTKNVNRFLNQFSVEMISMFLAQIPDLSDALIEWRREGLAELEAYPILEDIARLDSLGVRQESISVVMRAIKISPFLDKSLAQLGNKRQRNQRAKRLTSSVNELRNLATLLGEPSALMWKEVPNPSIIASELELLSSMVSWGHTIYDFLGANHLLEVSKFALSSLVRETTGMYLDREVSNLISAALDDCDYDETRHRVWRADNYKRLQQNVPIVTRILIALNSVRSGEHENQVAVEKN